MATFWTLSFDSFLIFYNFLSDFLAELLDPEDLLTSSEWDLPYESYLSDGDFSVEFYLESAFSDSFTSSIYLGFSILSRSKSLLFDFSTISIISKCNLDKFFNI